MARAYRGIREHLDDLIQLALLVLRRPTLGDARALAELDLATVELSELVEARLEVTAARGEPMPLDQLRTAFQLEATEQRCLWLLVALAVSSEARALAGGSDALTLEALDAMVYRTPELRDRFVRELGAGGRLLRYGLIEAQDDGATGHLARPVRIAEPLVELAYGASAQSSETLAYATLVEPVEVELLMPGETRELVRVALRHQIQTGGGGPVPVVRGADGSGRRALIGELARELGASLLVVRCADLAKAPRLGRALVAIQREAILHRAVVVLAGADALASEAAGDAAARAVDAAFRGYVGPVAMTASTHLAIALVPARGTMIVDLPLPTEAQRAVLWMRHLGGARVPGVAEVAAEAAARYRLSPGQIERAARVARARTTDVMLADAHAGVRSALDDQLSSLGSRIEWKQGWTDLVLPEDSLDELREMIGRVAHRRQVLDDWGFAEKVAKGLGLAVLFSGPPGTGKTMAAGLVARELGLDLYAIDLSRMVSKYVGETEKNLAQVFDAAEVGHAVLLFDEADALFSKRTEVKSSVDRYANLEVNYLLQRMEAFSGITILTTNFDAAIDDAFRRRLSFHIKFPVPEVEERARLWQAVIPERALGDDVDFGELAHRFEMTGGYIKNAALRAAFLAAADGVRIGMAQLLRAAMAEYASMGKVVTGG